MLRFSLAVVGLPLLVGALARGQSPAVALPGFVRFAGIEWQVKDSGETKVGPGPNWFSSENVLIDSRGRLHLRASERERGCVSSEVVAAPSLGYGTYRFGVDSNLDDLAANLVLGLFLWDDSSNEAFHREMDVELGRWGRENNEDAQFVIQPPTPVNIRRFSLPPRLHGYVFSFTWGPGRVSFRADAVAGGTSASISEHVFERMIPEPGGEQARINLWCMDTRAPGGGTTEVILSSFDFTPLPGPKR